MCVHGACDGLASHPGFQMLRIHRDPAQNKTLTKDEWIKVTSKISKTSTRNWNVDCSYQRRCRWGWKPWNISSECLPVLEFISLPNIKHKTGIWGSLTKKQLPAKGTMCKTTACLQFHHTLWLWITLRCHSSVKHSTPGQNRDRKTPAHRQNLLSHITKEEMGKKSNSHMSVKGMHLLFKNCWSPCKQFCIKCTCKFAVSKYQHGKEKKSSESPSEIKAKCLWLLCNCPYHTLLRLKHSERVFEWENDRNWMHESERFNTLEVLRLKYHCQVFLWERGETQEGWDERNAEHQLRSRGEESRSKVVLWLPAHTNVPSVTEGQVMWSVAGQQARRINIVQGFLISVVFQMIKPSSGSWSEDFVFANSSPEEWLTS